MSTRETWDEVYSNFKEFNSIDESFYKRLTSIILSHIENSSTILEVGSGFGFLTSFFQKKGFFSVGLDRSFMPVKVAQKKFGVSNLILGDMFNIPIKSESFDVVWNEGVLEHFAYPKNLKACKEMVRVSKEFVIIAVPNRYAIWPIRKTILKLIKKWPYGYEESYSVRKLKKLMEESDLEILSIEGVKILPPIKEKRKLKDILYLATGTIPLKRSYIDKLAKNSVQFEENHKLFTKLFAYEIIAIGRKKTRNH